MTRWQKQELSNDGLERVFQDVTRAVIKEQEEAGIDLPTDGQIRWEDLVTPLARKVEGFEINGLERFFDNNVYYRRPILTKTPVRKRPIFLSDYLFAKSCTKKPVKVVLPGPYSVVKLSEDRYYKNEKPFLRSIAEILNEEAKTLAQAGAMLIQFDEPALGFGKPPLKQVVEAINIATQGVKAKTALYTYFGSLNGALEHLQRCRVDLLGVDVVSDPNAIGAIRRQKWTKELALGCLDARNTKLESVTELHALFDVVLKRFPKDRLHVNPNCGLEFLPYEQARQKLDRLGEAVRRYRP
jgi:5-methyltetrahydropteroyltriglutamate--homocysteine methyltransferase